MYIDEQRIFEYIPKADYLDFPNLVHKLLVVSERVIDLGGNYRIREMRSALGHVQLAKELAGNHCRGELVELYRRNLTEQEPDITVPFTQARGQSSYHIMPVLLPEGVEKLAFMAAMKTLGIQTSWHFPPVQTLDGYVKEFRTGNNLLPLKEIGAAREVTLPLYPTMK